MNDTTLADAVREIRECLDKSRWKPANSAGELINDDGTVWFGSTYTHGEYTVTASIRPRGFGKAEGIRRVRLTPSLLAHRPELPRQLAEELVVAGLADEVESEWPPPMWEELSRV